MNYLTKEHPEIDFTYKVQKEAGGIAQALSLARNVVEGSKIAVILGDNIFRENFYDSARRFEESDFGAMLFLKRVPDPDRFGVAEIRNRKIISIEEKPKKPKSNLAVTGLYLYDSSVFEKIKTLKPSARGELEITDVNNLYVEERKCGYKITKEFWSDAGTHESLRRTAQYIERAGLDKFLV
jgi:glucose-1-phosphate thymidylyltransferase